MPLFIDDSITWEQVEAFYTESLARSTAGFVRQPITSAQPSRYRLAVWARPGGLFRSDEALAVALVYARPGKPFAFLLRLRTTDEKPR